MKLDSSLKKEGKKKGRKEERKKLGFSFPSLLAIKPMPGRRPH